MHQGCPHDLGLLGLVLLAQFHGIAADPAQLSHPFGRSAERFSETDLLLAAKQLELKACIVTQPLAADGEHLIVARCDGDKA